MDMKNILIPTDFSQASEYALQFCTQIDPHKKSIIHLFHVVEIDMNLTEMELDVEAIDINYDINSIEREIHDSVKKASLLLKEQESILEHKGFNVQTHIISGDPVGEILSFIEQFNINLVIMGSHGSRGINEVFIGSNAQKINRLSPVPVFTLKNEPQKGKFENFVFCSDFEEPESIENLNRMAKIIQFYDAQCKLLYINTPNRFQSSLHIIERIEAITSKSNIKDYEIEIFNADWIEQGILEYAEHYQPDAIAIGMHSYSSLKKLFRNNITETVINHSSTPILSLRLDPK